MDVKMLNPAQLATQQFAKNVMHGIYNVKIVEKKMELALLQKLLLHVIWDAGLLGEDASVKIMESVDFLTLDAKLANGGSNTEELL